MQKRQEIIKCLALFDGLYFHHSEAKIYELLPTDPMAEQAFSNTVQGLDDDGRQALTKLRTDARFQALHDLKAAENGQTDPELFIKRIHSCEDLMQPIWEEAENP